jgi:predicted secreted hydrolase
MKRALCYQCPQVFWSFSAPGRNELLTSRKIDPASLASAAGGSVFSAESATRPRRRLRCPIPAGPAAPSGFPDRVVVRYRHLATPDGRHFGYQLTFFRRFLAPPAAPKQI